MSSSRNRIHTRFRPAGAILQSSYVRTNSEDVSRYNGAIWLCPTVNNSLILSLPAPMFDMDGGLNKMQFQSALHCAQEAASAARCAAYASVMLFFDRSPPVYYRG